ncbi:hypothetical protein ACFL1S_09195 [Pseudomonadota bacterium]
MTDLHPLAPHHLPVYLPGPDGSDPLFTAVVVLLLAVLMGVGVLYFKLHSLPELMGEKYNSTQLQLVSVLAVLALFTHNNAFWILALLIAVIRLPDFSTPINSIADSLKKLANKDEPPNGDSANHAGDSDIPNDPPPRRTGSGTDTAVKSTDIVES